MLSRTAASLYWIGRYMERAEFTSRLVEATLRLSALGHHAHSDQAWHSALSVVGAELSFAEWGESFTPENVTRYLTLAESNPSSIRSCIAAARANARAARTALSIGTWEQINRAWLLVRDRAKPGGPQATMNLVDSLRAEFRGFDGALGRMLRNEGHWFMRLGSVLERGDSTARLLDVKYYLLLPPGQEVGGALDRDQWTTILQIVSAKTAYRHIYREALQPWLVADFLIFRREMPRSLAASAEETVGLLNEFAARSGRQGPADRLARQRLARMADASIDAVIQGGLHEWLNRHIAENAALDDAIARQFRFD
ncbi:MAG: alpha-E domain-containing protein [Sphingosinicella sp.]|uniref:alpha-E domain-containing protein n=1 Tax=Sphingosinicella sp. TaxID=1917971 RepID=UPI004037C385